MRTSAVSLHGVDDYDPELVQAALRRGLDLFGGAEALLDGRRKVLVKPSMLREARPGEAVTTHPVLVEAVCRAFVEAGAEVVVGDSCGGVDYGRTGVALETTGIAEAASRGGARWVNFDTGGHVPLRAEGGCFVTEARLARAVVEADFVVSLPKLKTHMEVQLTGAVKNMLGCIPGSGKLVVHKLAPKPRDLGEALLDVHSLRPADLAVMDAIWAMEGPGPSRGSPRKVGAMLVSPSATALDWVAARLLGFDPLKVPTVRAAARRGLGPRADEEVELLGDDLAALVPRAFVPASTWVMEAMPRVVLEILNRRFFDVWVEVDGERCRRCGLCVRSCPVSAIDGGMGDRAARIDRGACVRCFCCHELCPHDALVIRKSLLVRLLSQ